MQAAIVSGIGTAEAVAKYLPASYRVVVAAEGNRRVLCLIEGTDEAGWTFEGYVTPRLQSGLYAVSDIDSNTGYSVVLAARALTAGSRT